MTDTCLNLTFSNKLLTDSLCCISESVNHISDHRFKCPSGSEITTDQNVVQSCASPVFKLSSVLILLGFLPNLNGNSTI